jgi:hypothetical protein
MSELRGGFTQLFVVQVRFWILILINYMAESVGGLRPAFPL